MLSNGAILDEIQRAPEIPSYIQDIVDAEKSPERFILTGSKQFEVMNTISQTLAGRTALLKLLSYEEFSISFFLTSYDHVVIIASHENAAPRHPGPIHLSQSPGGKKEPDHRNGYP
ncbi:MAG: AAA family ATPase [Deltaproteobacteria bacterium]|nr:AAA family ATPase [Deltaproteobacteria bacterium]